MQLILETVLAIQNFPITGKMSNVKLTAQQLVNGVIKRHALEGMMISLDVLIKMSAEISAYHAQKFLGQVVQMEEMIILIKEVKCISYEWL